MYAVPDSARPIAHRHDTQYTWTNATEGYAVTLPRAQCVILHEKKEEKKGQKRDKSRSFTSVKSMSAEVTAIVFD